MNFRNCLYGTDIKQLLIAQTEQQKLQLSLKEGFI